MIKYCAIIFLCFFNSCALSYFTEPDVRARKEMLKNEMSRTSLHAGGCMGKNVGTCSAQRKRYSYSRYKLKEKQSLSMLNNKDDALRTQAVTEMSEARYLNEDVIERIKNMAITDPSKWVRRASVKAISKISGKHAIPTLKIALKDRDKWVRHSASQSLAKLD